jgi:hypothetical protein
LDGFAAAAAAAAALLWLLDSYTHLSPSPLYYVINIYTSSTGVSTLWYICMSRFCVLWNEHWRNKFVINFFRTELTCCYPHLRLHPKNKNGKSHACVSRPFPGLRCKKISIVTQRFVFLLTRCWISPSWILKRLTCDDDDLQNCFCFRSFTAALHSST